MFKAIVVTIFLLINFVSQAQNKIDQAVDFTLADTDGNFVNLFDALESEKTVLLYFYSTTCLNCALEAPIVDSVFRQFGSGQGELLVWGIVSSYSNIEMINEFVENTQISFPSFPTGHAEDVFSYYNIQYTPQVKIICDYQVSPTIPNNQIIESLGNCMNISNIEQISQLPNISFANNIIEIQSESVELVKIYDLTGRLLATKRVVEPTTKIILSNNQNFVLAQFFNKNGTIQTVKIVNR
jgi:peroxiredoxin